MKFKLFLETHKTLFIIIMCTLVLLLLAFIFIFYLNSKYNDSENKIPFYSKKNNKNLTYTEINSKDNTFSLKFNDKYSLKNNSSNDYVIYLSNSDNFSCTVSCIEKYNFSLQDIFKSDQKAFLETLGTYSELTDISNKKYENISGYSYSLKYSKDSVEYNLIEFVTEINNQLYFFDIQYQTTYASKYKNLPDELLNSISLNTTQK